VRALPERQYFDLEGAAEYLGCSVSDVKYHLQEDNIRYGREARWWEVSQSALVPLDKLSDEVFSKVTGLGAAYWGSEGYIPAKVDADVINEHRVIDALDYLYIRSSSIRNFFTFNGQDGGDQGDVFAYLLEDIDGREVTFWSRLDGNSYALNGIIVGNLVAWDGFLLKDPRLTLAELQRFTGNMDRASSPTTSEQVFNVPHKPDEMPAEDVKVVDQGRGTAAPFKLPQKANDIAIAMCEYGNRYFHNHGKVPTVVELLNPMLEGR
jgi:hypothetical protein